VAYEADAVVSSQRGSETALLAQERRELADAP
jgi:hypothetical protein